MRNTEVSKRRLDLKQDLLIRIGNPYLVQRAVAKDIVQRPDCEEKEGFWWGKF